MILTWPTGLKVTSCEEVSRKQIVTSEARNFKGFSSDLGYHRWDFRMRMFCEPTQLRSVRAFIYSLQTTGNHVYYSDPDWQTGVANKTTNGARNAGDTNIALTSIAGVEAGMFINIGSNPKLYFITAVTGNTLTLNCPLAVNVPASSVVVLNSPKVLLEMSPDLRRSANISKGLTRELTNFNLRLQEVI